MQCINIAKTSENVPDEFEAIPVSGREPGLPSQSLGLFIALAARATPLSKGDFWDKKQFLCNVVPHYQPLTTSKWDNRPKQASRIAVKPPSKLVASSQSL